MVAVAACVVIEDFLIDHVAQGNAGHTACCTTSHAAKHCADEAADSHASGAGQGAYSKTCFGTTEHASKSGGSTRHGAERATGFFAVVFDGDSH